MRVRHFRATCVQLRPWEPRHGRQAPPQVRHAAPPCRASLAWSQIHGAADLLSFVNSFIAGRQELGDPESGLANGRAPKIQRRFTATMRSCPAQVPVTREALASYLGSRTPGKRLALI